MDHKVDNKTLAKRDKEFQGILDSQLKDIRVQLNDQLKCLDGRVETQLAIVAEIQDYFRRRAEVETEYSKSLDKLSRSLVVRHKEQKQKREQWHLFSTYSCWKQLIEATRRESRDRAIVADIYNTNIMGRLSQITEDVQRIYRKCREISFESHEELLKVLHELHTTMKTYHTYWGEFRTAESKLMLAESQKRKLELSIPPEKLTKRKKFRVIEKDIEKRKNKYNDARTKALKARNDYLLCMDAANAALHKYFVDDLSDIMDCMDLGFHHSMANALRVHMSAEECMRQSKQISTESLNKCLEGLDSRLDKQKFLEHNNSAFMIPKKFEFMGQKGDDATQISQATGVVEDLEKRYAHLCQRLTQLKTESEEIWKTMETAEKSLMEMVTVKDFSVSAHFYDAHAASQAIPLTTSGSTSSIILFHNQGPSIGAVSPSQQAMAKSQQNEPINAKMRQDRNETEDFYLSKFRQYMLDSNLTTRLQAKFESISKALGPDAATRVRGEFADAAGKPPRRKRIGRPMITAGPAGAGGAHAGPKLFGGSLEEYLEASNEEIPLVVRSCVRVINLYGLHHQGIFRVSGSQVEIGNFKDAFERGTDPLRDVNDASDINSVAGVLKLYLRELREPLFPTVYFEQLMDLAQLESKHEFVLRFKELVTALPRSVFVVMRYLFAFLNHLSEFSDENMMDPYNLAICFGPSLVPIPEDKDQVQYQNMVNELIKNVIIYHEDIFPVDGGLMYEKYLLPNAGDETDVGEAPSDSTMADDADSEVGHSEDEIVFRDKDNSLQLFTKSDVLQGLAQFDFTARSPRELSFKKGDTLALYSQVSSDWWRGAFKGRQGLIPDKYIVLKIEDEDKERSDLRNSSMAGDFSDSESSDTKRRRSSSSDSGRPDSNRGLGQPSPRVPIAPTLSSSLPIRSSLSSSPSGVTTISLSSVAVDAPSSNVDGRSEEDPLRRFSGMEFRTCVSENRTSSLLSSSASNSLGGSVDSLSKLSDIDEPRTESIASEREEEYDDDDNGDENKLMEEKISSYDHQATAAAVEALDDAMAEVLSTANKLAISEDEEEDVQRPVVTMRDPKSSHRANPPLSFESSTPVIQRVHHKRNLSADAEGGMLQEQRGVCKVEAYGKIKRESLENVSTTSNFRIRRSLWEERAAGGEPGTDQVVEKPVTPRAAPRLNSTNKAPDLVMDLPISSSPPSSSSSPGPNETLSLDSPETSAADRFAESNQSTLKKNVGAIKRESVPEPVVIEVPRKSVSDLRAELESSVVTSSSVIPIVSPAPEKRRVPKFPITFPLPSSSTSSTGPSPMPSPKPQVLRKPALPGQRPSPETSRKTVNRFFDSGP